MNIRKKLIYRIVSQTKKEKNKYLLMSRLFEIFVQFVTSSMPIFEMRHQVAIRTCQVSLLKQIHLCRYCTISGENKHSTITSVEETFIVNLIKNKQQQKKTINTIKTIVGSCFMFDFF